MCLATAHEIEIHTDANESESRCALDALCLEGARKMLHRALELEVALYLERHREARDEKGHALVTRHGKARPRQLTTGDFQPALTSLLGEEASAGLSPTTITRLLATWQKDYEAFRKR